MMTSVHISINFICVKSSQQHGHNTQSIANGLATLQVAHTQRKNSKPATTTKMVDQRTIPTTDGSTILNSGSQ